MGVAIVAGGQYGGEGKGKVTSYLSIQDKPAIVARSGGPNSGHTVFYKDRKYRLRMIPSGVVYESSRLLLGAGALVDSEILRREIDELQVAHRTGIDFQAGIIESTHRKRELDDDNLREKVGSTCSGTGSAGSDRVLRRLRLARDIESLGQFLTDVALEVNNAVDMGLHVLVEGTQGSGLSLYHGPYPYVTSYDTSASAIAASVGLGPRKIAEIILVIRTFPIRVAAGPLKDELSLDKKQKLGLVEYATVTRRLRRVGEFDIEPVKRAAIINSATQIALTGVDYLNNEARGTKEYDELPADVQTFISRIENELKTPVTLISTGPETESMIDLRDTHPSLRGKKLEQAHIASRQFQPFTQA